MSCDDRRGAAPRAAVMRELWGRMAALYGGQRWASATSALPVDAAGRLTLAASTWAAALAGITEEQIAAGLRACLASNDEYVPTPMRFRARCLGIPSLAAVRLELREGRTAPPTPFARLVWQKLDHYALARADQQRAARMVEDAYSLASEHVMRGHPLPEVSGEIEPAPAPPRSPATPATVERALREIDQALHGTTT